jgi:hypothetical protein
MNKTREDHLFEKIGMRRIKEGWLKGRKDSSHLS